MTVRIHIDRLVVDPDTLSRRQVPAFRAALARELDLHMNPGNQLLQPPRDTVAQLARQTAIAIHARIGRS